VVVVVEEEVVVAAGSPIHSRSRTTMAQIPARFPRCRTQARLLLDPPLPHPCPRPPLQQQRLQRLFSLIFLRRPRRGERRSPGHRRPERRIPSHSSSIRRMVPRSSPPRHEFSSNVVHPEDLGIMEGHSQGPYCYYGALGGRG